jgi:hypothetical protein
MAIDWIYSLDDLDWDELSALYRAAPLGNKKPSDLKTAFSNSMLRAVAAIECTIFSNNIFNTNGTAPYFHSCK